MAPTRRPSRRRTTRAGTRVTARNHGQNRSATARAVPAGMIPQPRRGRCAGRGPPQQSLRSCRYSGYAAPFSRMAQERAHIRDGRPTVRGSHHGAPLGDEESAQQGGSPRTCLRTVPDHPAQQAPSDALGDRSAPGRGGRRRRAGSRPPSARYGPCSRAGAVTPPAPHGHATAASTGARRSRASRREPSIPKAGGGKARRRFPPQGSIYFRYPPLPARHGAVRSAHGRPSAGSQADRYADGPPAARTAAVSVSAGAGATLGDRGASGRSGRRRRAGSRARCTRRCTRRRAGTRVKVGAAASRRRQPFGFRFFVGSGGQRQQAAGCRSQSPLGHWDHWDGRIIYGYVSTYGHRRGRLVTAAWPARHARRRSSVSYRPSGQGRTGHGRFRFCARGCRAWPWSNARP